jgi:hypothetical protein
VRSYKRKPYIVGAVKFDGSNEDVVKEAIKKGNGDMSSAHVGSSGKQQLEIAFPGISHRMFLEEGQWLIHGPEGEWRVTTDDLFHQDFEEA